MNSIDLYDITLENDKPFIDSIIERIEELIEINVEENNTIFYYDTSDLMDGLGKIQKNRVADEIILYFRKRGLKITIADKRIAEEIQNIIGSDDNYSEINNGMFYSYLGTNFISYVNYKSYNFIREGEYIFQIKLNIRLAREYMKSYC